MAPPELFEAPLLPKEAAAREEAAATPEASTAVERCKRRLDRAFRVTERGSSLGTELRAGTTAFLATCSNFVVNAHILSHAGLDAQAVVVNAAFATGLSNIVSGILSNLPLGLMPGVGPNVLLAYSLVAKKVCSTEEALAISMATGGLLFALSLTPVTKLVLGLVPMSVKHGLLIGTGLLSALIGFKSIGVVVPDVGGTDIVALGLLNTLEVKISLVFLILIVSMLHLGVKGGVLAGISGGTLVFWAASGDWPAAFLEPSIPSMHAVDFRVFARGAAWANIGALLMMVMFSINGAVMSSASTAGLLRPDGGVNGRNSVYLCCGAGTVLSGALGSAPIFVSMSASAGIHDGGRTGLVSIVIGVYSLLTSLLLSPLVSSIPRCAIAPVLVLVGMSMTGEASQVQWRDTQGALPAFLCAVFQPFTYSVANGLYAGVGMSLVLFFSTGRFVAYMPCVQRRLGLPGAVSRRGTPVADSDSAPAADLDLVQAPGAAQLLATLKGAECRARSRSLPDLPELRDEVPVRGAMHKLGLDKRREAEKFVQRLADLMGLDQEEMRQIFEERLDAGRYGCYVQPAGPEQHMMRRASSLISETSRRRSELEPFSP